MANLQDAASMSGAFFDVDGTLVKTTIVHYYAYFKRRRMSPMVARLWSIGFLIRCLYFLLLDKRDRSRFNVIFYRGYAGLPVGETKKAAIDCHKDILAAQQFAEVAECVASHRSAGRRVVLVTGSIDFIIQPLADELGITDIIAPALIESDGVFTGELSGPPIGDKEKARRIRAFAVEHDIDLSQSHAYGDSIADLPMLEAVANPHAVNPDGKLREIAALRDWPIHEWAVAPPQDDDR